MSKRAAVSKCENRDGNCPNQQMIFTTAYSRQSKHQKNPTYEYSKCWFIAKQANKCFICADCSKRRSDGSEGECTCFCTDMPEQQQKKQKEIEAQMEANQLIGRYNLAGLPQNAMLTLETLQEIKSKYETSNDLELSPRVKFVYFDTNKQQKIIANDYNNYYSIDQKACCVDLLFELNEANVNEFSEKTRTAQCEAMLEMDEFDDIFPDKKPIASNIRKWVDRVVEANQKHEYVIFDQFATPKLRTEQMRRTVRQQPFCLRKQDKADCVD